MGPTRRLAILGAAPALLGAGPAFAPVRPGVALAFPRDHGAHPEFRTEWWYVTGWLRTANGKELGFQVTFFRTRPAIGQDNPSAFAPRQVLFAHAAISDPAVGKLLHANRIARAGFGLAEAALGDTRLVLDDWTLARSAAGAFQTKVAGAGFALDLTMAPGQAPLLQGDRGYSRKGPDPAQASYYYSLPHLKVSGALTRQGRVEAVTGEAWLDREWSSTLLDPRAVGWDWTGLNLDDGGALTAFQVRDAQGQALWAGGSHGDARGRLTIFRPGDVAFETGPLWRSPRTGAAYPTRPRISVRLPGGVRTLLLTPLFDDQELDSRPVGPVYWEGAVRVPGGRGYLELTGYQSRLRL